MDSRPKQTAQCLSQESRDVIVELLAKEKSSIRGLQKIMGLMEEEELIKYLQIPSVHSCEGISPSTSTKADREEY